jgi:DNA primase
MLKPITLRDHALHYHKQLPDAVRRYLTRRGVAEELIHRYLLGWDGRRITIPIWNRNREIAFFKLAKNPFDRSKSPKMIASRRSHVELYGWDTLLRQPQRVVICEGEFDRLVLESNGFPAVTSTGGAGAFEEEWASHFTAIRDVYVCFDNDEAGADGARRVMSLLARAKLVTLPAEVGRGGDITDFFATLGRTRVDFEVLLSRAVEGEGERQAAIPVLYTRRAERLKREVPIARIIRRYTQLRHSGERLVGRCPFHDDRHPSLVVYPQTNTFHCFGCSAHGDAIAFLMRKEHLTFGQALEAIERLTYSDDSRETA